MKIAPTLLIICLLAVGIFLMGIGCEQKPAPPPPPPPGRPSPPPPPPPLSRFEQWRSWIAKWEEIGYKVLTVEESKNYLNQHKISTHDVDFLDTKFMRGFIIEQRSHIPREEFVKILEKLGDDLITIDHNGNLRVAVVRFNGYSSSPSEQWKSWVADWKKIGYKVLTVEQSQQWLKEHPEISIVNTGFLFITMVPGAIITVDHNSKTRVAVKR